jgi:hypothetical protein
MTSFFLSVALLSLSTLITDACKHAVRATWRRLRRWWTSRRG